MMQFVWSPEWFFNIDSLFEVFSLIITVLIAIQVRKVWKFTHEKRYQWASISFWLIAAGLFLKILTNVAVYNFLTVQQTIGSLLITYQTSLQLDIFFIIGLVLYRLFFLLGMWGFFNTLYHSKEKHQMIINFILLILISGFIGHQSFFIFHLVSAVILAFIVKYYLSVCMTPKDNNKCMRKMAMAFSLLLMSQVSFIFTFFSLQMYVVAEAFQLLGFVFLMMQYYALVFKK